MVWMRRRLSQKVQLDLDASGRCWLLVSELDDYVDVEVVHVKGRAERFDEIRRVRKQVPWQGKETFEC